MPRFIKKSLKKAGSAPGTLVHVGDKRSDAVAISVMDYDIDFLRERKIDSITEAIPMRDSPTTTWIDISGIHNLDLIEKTGAHFGIHPLTLEDVVNTGHRPKIEAFDNYLFIVLKMLQYDPDREQITSEQISLLLGPHWLISFQEVPGDIFDPVRERIRKGRLRIRNTGCDYLAYALMDAIVDHYFHILEKIGNRIEQVEEEVTENPEVDILQIIHALKSEVIYLRKQVWPLREIVNHMSKEGSDLIKENTHLFLGDVYDHVVQVIDTIESYRDLLGGMLDLYLSMQSNRMNEVMKVLTIIATIFIPITFVAGIYGMNFKNMPELEWGWGYGMAWLIMVVVAVCMLFFFRKKKWL
jgi:magnesium transporter